MRYLSLTILVIGLLIPYKTLSINKSDAKKIGMQIWKNEAAQREDLLVFWHEREPFPSLGIGHAIWFPQGIDVPYKQQFPTLCSYLKKHGVKLPEWLEKAKETAPWKSRSEFLQDTTRTTELRTLLASTIDLQTYFMIEQLRKVWKRILNDTPPEKRAILTKKFNLLRSSIRGNYALIDYLNFKGSGINPREECNGDRWGLLQVLSDMPDTINTENATKAFSVSAAKILLKRIENSAPDYPHLPALPGWIKRVCTYSDPQIL